MVARVLLHLRAYLLPFLRFGLEGGIHRPAELQRLALHQRFREFGLLELAPVKRGSTAHWVPSDKIDAVPTTPEPGVAARTRPMWKRVASRARNLALRIVTPLDRIIRWRSSALLPPAHLRIYYYGTWSPDAFARHCDVTRTELLSRGLLRDHRVLDIGSGIGNLAIGLRDYLRRYDGIEIHREAVAWCQRAITRRHPTFRFHHADLISRAYNPRGSVSASDYRFPFADSSFDFIFLASVFTHMLPDAVEHYLHEISRLLAPGGVCVASFFLLNDETCVGVETGRSFMSFPLRHPSGLCRLHDANVPEAAVAIEEQFVRRVLARVHLDIRDLRRGRWWSGERHDQDIVTVVRDSSR
jgi:SAM-dependent methyltransferase